MRRTMLALVLSLVALPLFAEESVVARPGSPWRDSPCRLVDTRIWYGSGSPITSLVFGTRAGDAETQGGESGCAIPADATGAILSVVALTPSASGWGRFWASGVLEPSSTSVNITFGQLNESTMVQVGLGYDGGVNYRSLFEGHLVVDVVGYTRPAPVAASIGPRTNDLILTAEDFVPNRWIFVYAYNTSGTLTITVPDPGEIPGAMLTVKHRNDTGGDFSVKTASGTYLIEHFSTSGSVFSFEGSSPAWLPWF